MATFVLVHGAFVGGWSWRQTPPGRAHLERANREIEATPLAQITHSREIADVLLESTRLS